jgi:hypothetical protein
MNSRLHIGETQYLSTVEAQNLIADSNGRNIRFHLYQHRNGFRYLFGQVREEGAPVSALPASCIAAPAENSTLALLAEKGISYTTSFDNRDFTRRIRDRMWRFGKWATFSMLPAFCFFIVVAGAASLLRRRNNQQSEPRPIAAARSERRVDKAFAALVACGMVAVAVFLSLTTDWKVRRIAADQAANIIAQHSNPHSALRGCNFSGPIGQAASLIF